MILGKVVTRLKAKQAEIAMETLSRPQADLFWFGKRVGEFNGLTTAIAEVEAVLREDARRMGDDV